MSNLAKEKREKYLIDKLSKVLLTMKRITSHSLEEFQLFTREDTKELLDLYNKMAPKNAMKFELLSSDIKKDINYLNAYEESMHLFITDTVWREIETNMRAILKIQAEEAKQTKKFGGDEYIFDIINLERIYAFTASVEGVHFEDFSGNIYYLKNGNLRIRDVLTGDFMTDNIRRTV
ncbi:MAG: hypothetical protein ABS904_00780 [Solibacillus isronensis]